MLSKHIIKLKRTALIKQLLFNGQL